MSNKSSPSLSFMQKNMIDIISELSTLLDVEYTVLVKNEADANEQMKLIVHDKKLLADEYANYCTMFHALPPQTKDGLAAFAKQHREFLEEFSSKLKRNFVLIEARYKHSQYRIQSVLDAIRSEEQHHATYDKSAKKVASLHTILSQQIAS